MTVGQIVFFLLLEGIVGLLAGATYSMAMFLWQAKRRYRRLGEVRCPECGNWVGAPDFTTHSDYKHLPPQRMRHAAPR
ncbi:MAG: hypothetical protein ACLQFR_29955 [Streptosporangiaceae bacterium]